MIKEQCSFNVVYSGEEQAIKMTDFSQSLSGVKAIIEEAFVILNGKKGEFEFTISERGINCHENKAARTFSVYITAKYPEGLDKSLGQIIELLGFNNSKITREDYLAFNKGLAND